MHSLHPHTGTSSGQKLRRRLEETSYYCENIYRFCDALSRQLFSTNSYVRSTPRTESGMLPKEAQLVFVVPTWTNVSSKVVGTHVDHNKILIFYHRVHPTGGKTSPPPGLWYLQREREREGVKGRRTHKR